MIGIDLIKTNLRVCSRCIYDERVSAITFDKDGVCNYCKQLDGLVKEYGTGNQKGDYIKILGRKTEIINVGGEKVYPQEIENVILKMDNVVEITVYGEKNAIVGNIVCAKVRLDENEGEKEFSIKLKQYCRNKMQEYKVPVKIRIVQQNQFSERFKKIR